jgi:hypothetical protein
MGLFRGKALFDSFGPWVGKWPEKVCAFGFSGQPLGHKGCEPYRKMRKMLRKGFS